MTEREKNAAPFREAPQDRKDIPSQDEQQRLTAFRWVMGIGAASDLLVVVLYVLFALQAHAWQLWTVAGLAALGLLSVALTWWLIRRGELDIAGYLLIWSVVVSYGGGALVLDGITLYLLLSGIPLILVVGRVTLPRRWRAWLTAAASYGIWVGIAHHFAPLPRYHVAQLSISPQTLPYFTVGLTSLVAVVILGGVIRSLVSGTIRTRLLVSSTVVVLLTAAAVTVGSVLTGLQNGRQQLINQLESVVALKEAEITRWTQSVKNTLSGPLYQLPEHRFVEPEMAKVVTILLDESPDSEEYQDARSFLTYNFEKWLDQTESFETVFLMNPDGEVILSTDSEIEGENYAQERYFSKGTVSTFLSTPYYSRSYGETLIVVSRPVLGEYGRLLGVLGGRVSTGTLNRIMLERTGLGETGETYLVDVNRALLTRARFGEEGDFIWSSGLKRAVEDHTDGADVYEGYYGEPVVGVYRWLPDLHIALVAEQSRSEALGPFFRVVWLNVGVALAAVVFAGGISLVIARSIGNPLAELAEAAEEVASGNLERTTHIDRHDEIGTLADAFNSMTDRLRDLIGNLEQRVAERTRDLELRSAYLEASAEVGRAASSILDVDELVQNVVDLIRDRFSLYYVGLFLVDETGDWAMLRAGTGEAGQEMLAQGHGLAVGGDSMIGQCVAQGKARVALDVGEEAVHFDNPLLPETRSEVALPLQSRGRMYGAITVQSAMPSAFDEDIITALQTMADQVAVALDNAHLFAESEATLKAARRAYGELSLEAWMDLLHRRPGRGYHSDERGVTQVGGAWRPEAKRALHEGRPVRGGDGTIADGKRPLAVPIKVRGNVIGVLDTYKHQDAGEWTEEQVALLEELAEQLGVALDSARLHEDTQQRAAREQMLSEITASFTRSLEIKTVLQDAVQELGQLPDVAEVSVHIGPPDRASAGENEERDGDA